MNRINLLYFLFGLTLLFSIDDVEGIIGGKKAKVGEYTYQVVILKSGRFICGGSIFDDYHVITAAHCIVNHSRNFLRKSMQVLAGINDLKSKSSTRVLVNVEKVYITREFFINDKEPHTGDIAILKLKDPLGIDSNPNLSKITLPEKKSYVNKKVIITGFGWNHIELEFNPFTLAFEKTDSKSYGKMRFAEAKVLSKAECQKLYKDDEVSITKGHLCAQVVQRKLYKSEGVCSGDSGSPLVYNGNILIGVVSTTPFGCSESEIPAVYTRVSHYLKFIKKALNDKRDPQILGITLRISP